MNQKELLEEYRDLKISKESLINFLGVKKLNEINEVVTIECIHVIKLLESFSKKQIKKQELLDWVNTIWFSDTYDYIDEEMDSIASVMNKLEEIDEGVELNDELIDISIQSLKTNTELDIK